MKVLVTGANGQLGKTLQELNQDPDVLFVSSLELDLTNFVQVASIFAEHNFDFCVNCAAYTNVELAEDETEKAFLVNAEAVKNLAEVCAKFNTKLIHISTDYVFDGKKKEPYSEEDKTNPLNQYGASKLSGEQYLQEILKEHFIIRTSWLYSKKYGKNFYKFIERIVKEENEISIIDNQYGSPTKTDDLARLIFKIIQENSSSYGLYHYSGAGVTNWYEFAVAIVEYLDTSKKELIYPTNFFKTKAVRSEYSKLDTNKIQQTFAIDIASWQDSLNSD
ncbi:MAG: dTDP-4-dehydrorhamnose reductase [Flavobacteriaceae bacterium]|nr:dTDP-4-dehydrorhamnose reductase [Flavobacteriaceae bacterium]